MRGRVVLCACFIAMSALGVGAPTAARESSAPLVRQEESVASKGTCGQWTRRQACDVSWYRLLANPESYRGKIVRLTGYLVSDFGDLIFYPDKADYDAASEIDSVILERPFTIPKAVADKAATGAPAVIVMGRFKPMDGAEHQVIPRAGTLYDIQRIVGTSRVPSGTPLDTDGIRIQP